jgi:hypothetical protein
MDIPDVFGTSTIKKYLLGEAAKLIGSQKRVLNSLNAFSITHIHLLFIERSKDAVHFYLINYYNKIQ